MANYLGNELENLFCKPFDIIPKQGLIGEDAKLFTTLYGVSNSSAHIQSLMADDLRKNDWVFEAFEKRATLLPIEIDVVTLMFIRLSVNTITDCNMCIYYAQYRAKKRGITRVDFKTACTAIFPQGFPTTDGFRQLWKGQKTSNSNLIDIAEAATSIM